MIMAFRTSDSCGHGQPETTSHSSKRRSTRRSWFETPPATKFDIAVEKQAALPPNGKNKRRSIDNVETLILTHFTASPRIGFGKVLLGQSKTRTLMVQNPHDYEQEVVVERFPFKKYFNIDQTHFIIAPAEVISLTLTWTPEEAGSCREMILFHVSDVYRLQAYMFGTAEDPKPAKKKKKGMFGSRLRNQPPMNIVQTSALKSIHDSYSPRKSQEVRELRAQLQQFRDSCREQENLQPLLLDEAIPQTPPVLESTAICRSNERKDQNAMERQIIRLSPSLTKMSPIPTVADTNAMHMLNSYCAGPSEHSSVPQSDKNVKRSPLKVVSAENNQETFAKVTTVTPGENSSQNMSEKIIQQEKRNSSYEKQNIRTDEQTYLSPNSFLNESVCHVKPSTPEIGLVRSSGQVHKMEKVGIVSPNSFLEDLNSTKGQLEMDGKDFPSPSAVLNSSIPHDIMIKQLERIKTTLHKASTPLKTYTQEPVSMLKRRLKDETIEIKKGKKPRQAEQKFKLTAFSGVRVSNPASSKEKQLHRIVRERTNFAKISDTHSPRRKTFLVSKKQTVKRSSPCKGQAVTYPNRRRIQGNVYNKAGVDGKQAFSSVEASVIREEFQSTAFHRHQQEQTMYNSIAKTTQPPPQTLCEPGKFLPMSKSQRSVWCSPAVAGFTPPVMASRSECDSTSELTSSNVDTPHATDASTVDKPCVVDQGQHTSANHEVITSDQLSRDMTKCGTDMNKIENEGSSRLSTGRRLFADISMIEGTLDTSFKPLWAGNSGTVTKDKPSVLPHTEGNSSTSNKKLFPELSPPSESMKIDPETSQPRTDRRSSELFTNETEQRNFVIHSSELPMTRFCFDSPRFLPSSPSAEISRRATLTVTKSRPSEALLDAEKLCFKDILSVENIDMTCEQKVEIVGGEVWKVETLTIDRRNSNFPAASSGYDCATPPQLPTSPKPETSRRSTHPVKNPKVLNKDKSVPTQLSSLMVSSEDSTTYDKHDAHTPEEKDQDHPSYMLTSEKTLSSPAEVHHERKAIAAVHSESDDAGSRGKGVNSSYSEHVSGINKLIIDPVAQASKENENQFPKETFVDRVESHVIVNRQQIAKKSRFSTGEECFICDTSKVSGDMSVDSLEAHKNGSESDKDLVFEDKELEEEKEGSILPTDDKTIDTRCGSFASSSNPPVGKVVDILDKNVREILNDGDDVNGKSLAGNILQEKTSSSLVVEMPHAKKIDVSEESLLQNQSSSQQTLVLSYAAHEKPAASSACSFVVDFSASAPMPLTSKDICKAPKLPKTRSKTALYTEGQQQTLKPQMHNARSYTGLEVSTKKQTVSTSSLVHLNITGAAPTLMSARKGGHTESEIEATKSLKGGVRPVSATKSQKKPTKPSAGMSISANDREGKKPVVAKGIAQSQLILVKKPKNTMPKHPMPFAAKNMYYDERWQDKQERGFVHWLNFILTPPDEYNLANTKMKVDAGSLNLDVASCKSGQHYAPSKEVLSFRAYSARRSLNQLRRASCNLYQSDRVTHVIHRIELEVENRRLAVRTDRMIHADIGIKQRILDMLLMYNPLWLRIGLETAFGEVLPLQSNSDMVGLSRFILTRLLSSPDISAQYAHPTVPHLYQEGFADATARHTLKKFLLLVYFLDQAKRIRLINYDPCLFCKDADIKSSKELLIKFSRDYLSGEGDITKHLAYMGYTVSHVQTPLDEFDYSVKNLCTDLRDGLRLARVIMLLSNNWQCMPSLRGPAISRLQKIHNIELIFKVLTDKGVDLSTPEGGALNPRDIVDGHREKTLAFLWKLIFHFQTGVLLNEEDLHKEIGLLERSLKVKLWMQQQLSPHKVAETMARRDSGDPEVATDKPLVKQLLKWCRNVCLHYGVKVENFTVSFSDGRALCCLVHHYHPGLLPLTKIQFQTMQSFQEAAEVSGDQGDSDVSMEWPSGTVFGGDTSPELFAKLMANEKENFKTLYEKVSELGGIPLMLKASDMSNTIPDERIVMTYVSYLCARLLDLRQEARAARVIQLAWRRFRFRQSLALQQRRLEACLIIQRAFRGYLAKLHRQRQVTAASCIQAAWRVRQKVAIVRRAREDLLYHAAITVQKNVRTYLAQKSYQRQKEAVKIIQSWFRATWARQQFRRKREACLLLQHLYRGRKTTMAARICFLRQRQSAVLIQRAFRRKRAMKEEEKMRRAADKREEEARRREQAACLLQVAWRGRKCRQVYIQKIQAIIVLQAWWRMASARSQFIKMLTAVRIIQSRVRAVKIGTKARREFLDLRLAAVTIQKHWRRHQNQRDYQASRRAAVMIQANFRRFKCAAEYRTLRLAAISIQQMWRARLARDKARGKYKHMQAACITIQRWIRRKMRHQAARREAASCKIQALWRGYQARQQMKVMKNVDRQEKAATRIQAWTQACKVRREYRKFKKSVLLLQTQIRALLARKRFKEMQEAWVMAQKQAALRANFQSVINELLQRWTAAVVIQASWRCYRQKQSYEARKMAAVCIQAAFRGHAQRQRFLSLVTAAVTVQQRFRSLRRLRAAIVIQSWWRMCRERKIFLLRKSSAVRLQAAVRRTLVERRYRQLLQVTIFLQRKYRARLLGQAVRLDYQLMVGAAIVIQATWKMHVLRGCYLHLRQNIIKTQACCRRFLVQHQYRCLQRAAVCLQRQYRSKLLTIKTQAAYKTSRAAIIRLQARVKGRHQRHKFLQAKRACVVLQSATRMWLAQKQYQEQRHATIVMQQRWRAILLARRLSSHYIAMRMAAITLQAAFRGHLVRQSMFNQHQAAAIIQRAFRTHRSREKFLDMKKAALTLQMHFRAFLLSRSRREEFLRIQHACILVQALYRGHAARQRYFAVRLIIVKLQARVRGLQQQKRYKALHDAVIVCQRRYRAKQLGGVFREAFLLIREAAIIIQKHVRGLMARRQYQKYHLGATIIQAHIRGWLQRQEYARQKQAAAVLQSYFRAWREGRRDRDQYLQMRQAALTLQNAWRALRTRRVQCQSFAATVFQKHFRRLTAQKEYHHKLSCIVQAQAHVRRYLAWKNYSRKRFAVVKIQKRLRETLLAKRERKEFVQLRKATVILQSAYRGSSARCNYARVRQHVILLQAVVRGWLKRRHLQQLRQAVLMLERKHLANLATRKQRNLFLKQKKAAVYIQEAFRAWQVKQINKKTQAAICIQSHIRRFLLQQKFLKMKQATITLQAYTRRFLAMRVVSVKKAAILTIQQQVRWFILSRTLLDEVQRRRRAACLIQQAFRKHQRAELDKKLAAVIKIQTEVHRWQELQTFQAKKNAVVVLQSALRGWQGRQQATARRRLLHAVTTVQAAVRAHLAVRFKEEWHQKRLKYLQQVVLAANYHLMVIRIQRWYRRLRLERQARDHLHAVILLQTWFRTCIERCRFMHARVQAQLQQEREEQAARVIQRALRKWHKSQEEKRRERLVIKIQATWRGHRLRRSISNRKIASARRRVLEANEAATEEKKLGNRTASALDFLLRYKQLAYILESVMHLDVATRLSPVCCERLVEVNAVGVIYRLILSCNRSLPHMEVIKFCVNILLNLAKYEKTTAAVYEVPESVGTIVELMSIYREKGGIIFSKCCMLLAILGREPQRRTEIVAVKKVVEKLQSLHSLVVRKHHMQVNRARAVARASLNATLPSHLQAPSSIKMRPDWVLRRDSMQEIEDPLPAISFLLTTLHIGPK